VCSFGLLLAEVGRGTLNASGSRINKDRASRILNGRCVASSQVEPQQLTLDLRLKVSGGGARVATSAHPPESIEFPVHFHSRADAERGGAYGSRW
jgi:hypothetical protein